ncbi:MAG TPA: DUF5916 domain-containing protein [Longimicrobium sp.]|nr:DUF5916 domain-containing protein [Longimicrobium sp.]
MRRARAACTSLARVHAGCTAALLALPLVAAAQVPDGTGGAPRVSRALAAAPAGGTAPVMDGRLDDVVWQAAPVATGFVQREPDPGAAATLRTEVRVVHGDGALYVAARLYDHPDSVAAQLTRRDASGSYSDWMHVLLDSDDDNRSAFAFAVNPRGVQRDYVLAENGAEDGGWDAVWTARTRLDSLGWTAELRIPLSQLRYSAGAPSWGVNFRRDVARRAEASYWAPITPGAPGFVSRFGALTGLDGVAVPRRLEVQPYASSQVVRAPGDATDPFYSRNELRASGGFDFRYGLTPSLTLAGTVNPDFGQVEADPSEVNLTAFETLLPERRPFFVEGSDIFDFGLGGGAGQLFYSRRIGAPPHGGVPGDAAFADVPARTAILGAVKLSGKTAGGWSLGVLDVLTGAEQARYVTADGGRATAPVEPLTNFFVARVIRDFREGGSALGAMFTGVHRRMDDASLPFLRGSAYSGGFDGRHRFGGGNYEVSGYAVGSLVQGSVESIRAAQLRPGRYFQRPGAAHLRYDPDRTSLHGTVLNLEVERIGGGHWRWELGGRIVSPGFEANDAGYQPEADRVSHFGSVEYHQYEAGRSFRSWRVAVAEGAGWTTGGERLETAVSVAANAQLHSYWTIGGVVERSLAGLSTSELRGGPALATPGQSLAQLSVQSDPRRPLVGTGYAVLARQDQGAGGQATLGVLLAVRPSPRIDLSLQPQLTRLANGAQYLGQEPADGASRYYFARLDQTTSSLTARLSYTFTSTLSLQLYGESFISAGTFSRFAEVDDPSARTFGRRFRPASPDVEPDFNFKQFRSNAVLRWEYRPGSTVFVAWNADLRDQAADGSYSLLRDTGRLFRSDGTNVLLVKFSYWFGL